jgi:outer membrane biosynthesis protein TonB
MSRESLERVPALAAAVAFHVGVLVLALMLGQWLNRPEPITQITPVTLMTSADVAAARAAMQADQAQDAATPAPVMQAPEPAPAPAPAPTPTPAPPAPPTPAPKPSPAAPKATPAPTKPAPSMDFDALAKSLEASAKASGAKQSSAKQGPARPRTAVKATASNGNTDAISAGALASLGAELQRLWSLDCGVAGRSDAPIQVAFRLGSNGNLIGDPISSQQGASDAIVKAASDRAVRAVYAAQPMTNLPSGLYGPRIVVNFNAKQACSQR